MKRALVLSLICVVGFAFSGLAATLSGSWDTDVTIYPQQTYMFDAIALVSVLEVIYEVGDWTFTSTTSLSDAGWTGQDFAVDGVLGAFSLGSDLVFSPALDAPAFGSWTTTVSVSIAGVSFGATFMLADEDVELVLNGSGVAGAVIVSVDVTFGGIAMTDGVVDVHGNNDECDLDWAGVEIGIDFPFDCVEVESTITFNCSGFDSAVFGVQGVVVPMLPWVTLGAELTFTVDSKTLELTPAFDFGTFDCISFTLDMDYSEGVNLGDETDQKLVLGDIYVTHVGIDVDFGAVTFTGDTYLDGTEDYFEVYTISTEADACCDGLFEFDLGFYFLDGGMQLFDLSLIDVDVVVNITQQFEFNMGLQVDLEGAGFNEWTIGFLVTW
jgi:hypothetical protein